MTVWSMFAALVGGVVYVYLLSWVASTAYFKAKQSFYRTICNGEWYGK